MKKVQNLKMCSKIKRHKFIKDMNWIYTRWSIEPLVNFDDMFVGVFEGLNDCVLIPWI